MLRLDSLAFFLRSVPLTALGPGTRDLTYDASNRLSSAPGDEWQSTLRDIRDGRPTIVPVDDSLSVKDGKAKADDLDCSAAPSQHSVMSV